MRGFLALVGFSFRLFPDFATVAEHLKALTTNGAKSERKEGKESELSGC